MLTDQLRPGTCLFDAAKECRHCFQCVGLMEQKPVGELTVGETARLLEYKLYQTNLSDFSDRVNDNFAKNGGYEEIRYSLTCSAEDMFRIQVSMYNREKGTETPLEYMGEGMKSIYLLSLLEAYVEDEKKLPSPGDHGVSGDVSPPQTPENRQRDPLPPLKKESGDIYHPLPPPAGEFYQQGDPTGGAGRGVLFGGPQKGQYAALDCRS